MIIENMKNNPPDINNSTRAEREAYVRDRFRCISNCETCGNCTVLHGHDAEEAYADYIDGTKSFLDVTLSLRR